MLQCQNSKKILHLNKALSILVLYRNSWRRTLLRAKSLSGKGSFRPKGNPSFPASASLKPSLYMHASMINLQPTTYTPAPLSLFNLSYIYSNIYKFTMMTALSRRESWAAEALFLWFCHVSSSYILLPGRRRAGPPGRPGTLARSYVSRHSLSHSHVTIQAQESRIQELKVGLLLQRYTGHIVSTLLQVY
jgi:hypothetical protein